MKEIAYISRPCGLVFDDDVLAIVRTSRRRNVRAGITGWLLYDGKRFLQLLEGPDARVDDLYGRILVDPRHVDVRLLADGDIDGPRFSRWGMAYRRVGDVTRELGTLVRRDGSFGADLKVLQRA